MLPYQASYYLVIPRNNVSHFFSFFYQIKTLTHIAIKPGPHTPAICRSSTCEATAPSSTGVNKKSNGERQMVSPFSTPS